MATVARVVARIGDELLEITDVTGRYTLGSEPGCDFAAANLGMFALVTRDPTTGIGFVVRQPIGLDLAIDGTRSQESLTRLAPGMQITLRVGLVTLELSLAEPARATLPFAAIDVRALPFIAVSLAVHLSLWAVAITSVNHQVTRTASRVVTHPVLAYLAPVPSPPKATETRTPAARIPQLTAPLAPATPARAPHHATRRGEGTSLNGVDPGNSVAALVAASANLQRDLAASTLYNPEMHPPSFGGQQAMVPDERPEWGNLQIKTGDHYKTMSYDNDAPNDNDPATTQQLALCESRLCEATGGLETATVKQVVSHQMVPIAKCLGRKGPSFIVALDIALDGHVQVSGSNTYTHCVSEALAHVTFPKAAEPTHVAFTVGWPSP